MRPQGWFGALDAVLIGFAKARLPAGDDHRRRVRDVFHLTTYHAVSRGRTESPNSIDAVKIREINSQWFGAMVIAKALGIGRASVYRMSEAGY
jgi:hypothetical protein